MRGLPWPFALRRTPSAAQAPGQAGSGCSRALFGQPLAALCGEAVTLPQPIQDLLAILHQEGPSTEGIFRRAASGTSLRELREALDSGADVDLASQPVLLLGVILKGGREVACSQCPPPEAGALPPPAHRAQRLHQQDERQQPGHLRWAKPAEPSQREHAHAGGHGAGDREGKRAGGVYD
ncbi:T-cell activation Rho GTPase-activating protein-like [Pluvialis apricaria]